MSTVREDVNGARASVVSRDEWNAIRRLCDAVDKLDGKIGASLFETQLPEHLVNIEGWVESDHRQDMR